MPKFTPILSRDDWVYLRYKNPTLSSLFPAIFSVASITHTPHTYKNLMHEWPIAERPPMVIASMYQTTRKALSFNLLKAVDILDANIVHFNAYSEEPSKALDYLKPMIEKLPNNVQSMVTLDQPTLAMNMRLASVLNTAIGINMFSISKELHFRQELTHELFPSSVLYWEFDSKPYETLEQMHRNKNIFLIASSLPVWHYEKLPAIVPSTLTVNDTPPKNYYRDNLLLHRPYAFTNLTRVLREW